MRSKGTFLISKIISILGFIYLIIAILAPSISQIKINRISNTEILFFALILIFNSGLLEKLEDFSIDGTSIKANFKEIKELEEKQEKQQKIIKKLTQEQDTALKFALKGIIDQHEFKHLRGLNDAEERESEYIVKYSDSIKSFEKEIRHLIAVEFLDKKASISNLINELKSNQKANLRNYVNVTPDGQDYLFLRKKLGIKESVAERGVSND